MTSDGNSLIPNPSVGETRNQLSSLASQMRGAEGFTHFVLFGQAEEMRELPLGTLADTVCGPNP